MRTFRLSEFAKNDLARIYRQGLLEFGEQQAEKYLNQLLDRFDEITAHPLAYPAIDDIRKGYRRSVVGPDSIYFRLNDGVVEIVAIVGRQDVADWI